MSQYKVVYQKKNNKPIEEIFSKRDEAFKFAHCLNRSNDVVSINLLESHSYSYKFK